MPKKLTRNQQAPWQIRYFFLSEWPPALLFLGLALLCLGTVLDSLNSLTVLSAGLLGLSASFTLLYVLLNWWIPYRYIRQHGEAHTGYLLELSRTGNFFAIWQYVSYVYQDSSGVWRKGHFRLAPWHKVPETRQSVSPAELAELTQVTSQLYSIPQGKVPTTDTQINTFKVQVLTDYPEVSMPQVVMHPLYAVTGIVIQGIAMLLPLGPGIFFTYAAFHNTWVWPGGGTQDDPCMELRNEWREELRVYPHKECNPHRIPSCIAPGLRDAPTPSSCPQPFKGDPCRESYDDWKTGYDDAVFEQCGWWHAWLGFGECSVQYSEPPTASDCY